MRASLLNNIISSEVNLSKLSNARLQFASTKAGEFEMTSRLKFYSGEKCAFIGRFLRRKLPALKFITGNCSSPTSYYWS